MSEEKGPQPSAVPEDQANAGELTEADLAQVVGGLSTLSTLSTVQAVSGSATYEITQDVTVNKAKTADKAFSAMDAYIRG